MDQIENLLNPIITKYDRYARDIIIGKYGLFDIRTRSKSFDF